MTTDPLVIFTPSGKRGRFPVGTPVLKAAQQLGVDLDSVCGGNGVCSKCQVTPSMGEFPKHGVTVTEAAVSPINKVEERYDRVRGLTPGRRLGCQTLVQGDLVVDVPPESQVHKQVVRKRAEAREITLNPAIRSVMITVAEPDMHDPTGDFQRVQAALAAQWDIHNVTAPLSVLARLQPALRKGKWQITCLLHDAGLGGAVQLLDIHAGFDETPYFGLAIDLGSTTIAGHLCDLSTGEVVASAGLMNPQIRFGEDLMSRVSYGMMNEGGAAELTTAVRQGMVELCKNIATEASVKAEQIVNMTLVCNPVMHHLFLGLDPYELGQAPFALNTNAALNLGTAELGLGDVLHPLAQAYVLPCIAGHVGADAAAVALSEAPEKSENLVLLVDVGTNAEIILGNKSRVLACSSPTGPAFEGAQISAGQRAAPGAIERVEIDPITKEPRFKIIGSDLWSTDENFNDAVQSIGITGICGSGIIEAVAEMRAAGVLDAAGLIGSAEQTGSARCFTDGRTNSYRLWDGNPGEPITITNRDIREIQMAKAALYSGARLLMDKFNVDTVDRIVLAGAFGAHISPKHAMILGMIPDCDLGRVTSAGNAAGTGARIALLNRDARRDIEKLVTQIEKIETAVEPRFQEHFVNASAMPNAVDRFPHLDALITLPSPSFNTGGGDTGGGRRRRRRAT